MEFAIVFPGLVLILFAMGEVGTFEARAVLFDRGLNFAMRDLKLGAIPNPTPENIKARICDEAFLIQRSCMEGLRLEMVPINLGAPGIADNFLASEPQCRDRVEEEINPVPEPSLDPGQRLDPMLVRACLVIDPFFPSTFMGARLKLINGDERGYALLAQTAFMNEPPR
ncbi:MAG: hypothetical protein AAF415_02620 [Pseudomonadota bacterium]